MLKNYFKIAFRSLFKNKVYSFINIFGLAIGLTGFILITILLKNELSYDSFQKKSNRIYRVVEIQNQENIGKLNIAVTMGPLAKALKEYFPQVENSVRLIPSITLFLKVGNNGFYEKNVSFADNSVFNIFTTHFLKGNPETALQNPYSMVITETVARKYFGSEDPLNKTISVSSQQGTADYKVTGLINDYPENSHIYFNILASLNTVESSLKWLNSWRTNGLATYILLKKGSTPIQIENQFPKFIQQYIPPDKKTGEKSNLQMYLQPIKDIHLYSDDIVYQTYNHNQGSINNVYIFSLIALFILLIACINFMNLTTARSSKRIKEIGIRKVLGSGRTGLIYQFIGEAVLISFIALLISFLLVEIALPYFKNAFDERIIFSYQDNLGFILQLFGIAVIVGIIAGSYPAIFLSKFQPIQSLKGIISGKKEGVFLRKILVVLQFSIAISLIICTAVVIHQMNFIQNKNLGFNKEHVLYIPLQNKEDRSKIDLLKNTFLQNPTILNVAAGSGLTGASGTEGTEVAVGTKEKVRLMMRKSFVDYNYIKTMRMKIIRGRDFSPEYSSDSTSSVIINETAVKKLGWKNPIGKQFEGDPNKTVIGVVKDFNFFNLHSKIGPLMMSINSDRFMFLIIRLKPDNISNTVDFIKDKWESIFPDKPFDYSFLDQFFNEIYKSDKRTEKIFSFFSLFAIFIACLGLLGLISYSAEQKTKEIGVRKVLGASVAGIVSLLSKEFLKLILIANIIAWPLAYFVMNKWLQDFAYRININIWTFIVAGVITLIIAITTVSFQAIKAATANPVKSLKYE